MDDSYRISSSARAADPLVQALRHSTAPPAVRRRPAPVGERSSVTVDAYGADPTGQKDSTAAFRAALRAAGAGGVVSLPGGSVYALSDTVLVSQPVAIDCRATIRPFSGPKHQVPFFNISGVDGASFDGHGGACVFDGVSSAFANFTTAITLWDASNVSVAGIHVIRLAVNQTSASNPLGAVTLSAASGCVVRDSIIEDSGVAHSYHIGFGIYLVYSTDCNITNNTVRAVGSTGINDSGGLRNRFTANHLIKIGLFSFVSTATAALKDGRLSRDVTLTQPLLSTEGRLRAVLRGQCDAEHAVLQRRRQLRRTRGVSERKIHQHPRPEPRRRGAGLAQPAAARRDPAGGDAAGDGGGSGGRRAGPAALDLAAVCGQRRRVE